MMSLLAIFLYACCLAGLVQGTSERASVACRFDRRVLVHEHRSRTLSKRDRSPPLPPPAERFTSWVRHTPRSGWRSALAGAAITFWLRIPAWAIGWARPSSWGSSRHLEQLVGGAFDGAVVPHVQKAECVPSVFRAVPCGRDSCSRHRRDDRATRGKVTEGRSAIVVILVFLAVVAVPGYKTTRSTLHALTTVDPRNLFNQSRVDERLPSGISLAGIAGASRGHGRGRTSCQRLPVALRGTTTYQSSWG